jgi:hypothetical protein
MKVLFIVLSLMQTFRSIYIASGIMSQTYYNCEYATLEHKSQYNGGSFKYKKLKCVIQDLKEVEEESVDIFQCSGLLNSLKIGKNYACCSSESLLEYYTTYKKNGKFYQKSEKPLNERYSQYNMCNRRKLKK